MFRYNKQSSNIIKFQWVKSIGFTSYKNNGNVLCDL